MPKLADNATAVDQRDSAACVAIGQWSVQDAALGHPWSATVMDSVSDAAAA